MLNEYLQNAGPAVETVWSSIMPGVHTCCFTVNLPADSAPVEFSVKPDVMHFESFFCCKGSMTLERNTCGPLTVNTQELLLLSDIPAAYTARMTSPLSGVLLSVDRRAATENLRLLCHLLGDLELCTDCVRQQFRDREGCALLRATPWTRHVFSVLDSLPREEQGRYCMLKTLDFLYLLSIRSPLLETGTDRTRTDSYLTRTVTEMHDYMESHLDEKLTIDELSSRFHISPTAFKCNFRRIYSHPVHQWLQAQRMRKAAELLCSCPMTILQIAQAVGYEGVSQFNVAFKRQYGMTPMQYRKKPNTV